MEGYKNRLRILFLFLSLIMFLLIIRIYFHTNSEKLAVRAEQQYTIKEEFYDINYKLLDCNNKELIKYDKYYEAVIDRNIFLKYNSEKEDKNIWTLFYILRNYEKDFDYNKLIQSKADKIKINISEATYLKLKSIEGIKGFYVYEYYKADKAKAWSIENILTEERRRKDSSFKAQDSLEMLIYNKTKNNETFYVDFNKDEVGNIKKAKENDDVSKNVNPKTTIDKFLQDGIKDVIQQEKYNKYSQVGVILMESNTGKIKALTQKDEFASNVNLGVENGYFPGSTFKVLIEEAALENGVIKLSDKLNCSGKIFDRDKKHGILTVEEALVKSCNDIFAQIGWKVGYEDVYKLAQNQGFFDKVLNIDAENKGSMELKNDGGDLSLLSIGQNIRVTPVEAISIINTVVNDGIYIKPYILDSFVDNENNVLEKLNTSGKRVLSKSTANAVKGNLIKVVSDSGNGAYNAYIEGIEIGGKTGTSDRGNVSDGWFIGYFKVNNKNYTMLVFIPDIGQNQFGGNNAGPIFKEVVNKVYNYLLKS